MDLRLHLDQEPQAPTPLDQLDVELFIHWQRGVASVRLGSAGHDPEQP